MRQRHRRDRRPLAGQPRPRQPQDVGVIRLKALFESLPPTASGPGRTGGDSALGFCGKPWVAELRGRSVDFDHKAEFRPLRDQEARSKESVRGAGEVLFRSGGRCVSPFLQRHSDWRAGYDAAGHAVVAMSAASDASCRYESPEPHEPLVHATSCPGRVESLRSPLGTRKAVSQPGQCAAIFLAADLTCGHRGECSCIVINCGGQLDADNSHPAIGSGR